MKIILRLALRNLVRHTRRTVMTVAVIIAATAVLILGQGFIGGLDENIIVAAENGLVGHLLARPKDYPTAGMQHPIDELLTVNDASRTLLSEPGVQWTERIMFLPTAVAGADSLRVRAIGYDPVRDPAVFHRDSWRLIGKEPRAEANELLVSRGVARLLNLEPGKSVVLQVRTHQGAINALDFAVSGVVSTSNAAIDNSAVLMPAATAARLVGTEQPSHIAVRLPSRDLAPELAPRLAVALGDQAEVVTWEEETRELLALQDIRRRALGMFVFVLMVLAAFGIANTILMAAYERVRELGTLRAMGMPSTGVLGLFLWEGLFMGLIGSCLGATLGGALVAHWASHPLDFTAEIEKGIGNGIQMSSLLYTRFDPAVVAAAVALGVLVAALASIYPARVASNMAPAEAVRAS